MAKIKYDVSDVEVGGDIRLVPIGIYRAKIDEATFKKSSGGNDMVELVLSISRGEYKGSKLWHYVTFTEKTEFRVAELVAALGGRKKGTLDTDAMEGKEVQVKVKHETYEEEQRARVGRLLPLTDDDDEDEEDLEETDAEEGDDEDGEEITAEEIEEMDLDELKELIEEEELEVTVTKRSKVETIRAKVMEALEIEPEEEEEEEDSEDDDDEEADYGDWSVQELRDECKARKLKSAGAKRLLVKRLEKDDESGNEPF